MNDLGYSFAAGTTEGRHRLQGRKERAYVTEEGEKLFPRKKTTNGGDSSGEDNTNNGGGKRSGG
jgi:hypothetical protein